MDKKVIYPNERKDMEDLWLQSPTEIDQDCMFKKTPILELQAGLIKNYAIHYREWSKS